MFLSILITVYNCEQYLRECLDSVFTQDIPETDYEVICVNDGSTDGSLKILEEYKKNRKNLKIFSQENQGVVAARNAALKNASGDYIWFVDADDFISENILLLLKNRATATECDKLSFGAYTFSGSLSEELKKSNTLTENINGGYTVHACTHLLSNKMIKENNLYFKYPELINSEDAVFLYEFLRLKPKVEILKGHVVYFYRENPDSLTHSGSEKLLSKKARAHVKASQIFKQYYDSDYEHSEYGENLANQLASNLSASIDEALQLSKHERKAIMKELKASGLFPYKTPSGCTLKKSYMTTRTDIVGVLFDYSYTHIYTYTGYILMRILKALITLRHKGK